jgi:hypothetical protein
MAAMRRFRRGRATRKTGRRLIIVCEGRKLKLVTLKGFASPMRLSTLRVKVVHPNATDPLGIVNSAIDLVSQQPRDQWSREDSAWAVFDGDEHRVRIRTTGMTPLTPSEFRSQACVASEEQEDKPCGIPIHVLSFGICFIIRISWPSCRGSSRKAAPVHLDHTADSSRHRFICQGV